MQKHSIELVRSAPFDEISYIVWIPGRSDALVVDPGFDTRSILRFLDRQALRPAAILNTHGHIDHIAGNRAMKEAFPEAPLVIGRNESMLLSDIEANLSAQFGLPVTSPPADRLVDHGELLELAGIPLEVREIPGHSPGSVVYVCRATSPAYVLGGDVLFSGSVGRTDMGGNMDLLISGIRSKLFDLPESTIVYPGHGPSTTIGEERKSNPFAGEDAD